MSMLPRRGMCSRCDCTCHCHYWPNVKHIRPCCGHPTADDSDKLIDELFRRQSKKTHHDPNEGVQKPVNRLRPSRLMTQEEWDEMDKALEKSLKVWERDPEK